MEHESEKIIYIGKPSQMVNYNVFTVCVIIFIMVIFAPSLWGAFLAESYAQHKRLYMLASKVMFFVPIVWAFVAWAKVYNHKYTITTERLKEEEGVLSKITDELELFRVKDITYVQPFALRVIGCGNIILDTSDKSTPIVVLHAIKDSEKVINLLRKNVQIMRTKKGVREID